MKKILILSLNYYPFVGGAEVAVKEITDRMPPEEYEFHLLAPRYDSTLPKEEKMGNVHVHRYLLARRGATISDQSRFPLKLNKYLYQATAAWKAHRLHRVHHFDIVWAMMAHAAGIPAGQFKQRHPEIKYLLTLQEGDPPEYIEHLFRSVWKSFKRGFTGADGMQAISTFLLEWGRRMGFAGKGVVIPNAVDTKRFIAQAAPEDVRAIKERFMIQDGETTLITTSRLVHKNAIDDVIAALVHLPENVMFVVCGIGPLEAALKDQVATLSLAHRVRFVGQVSHADLPAALQASSIFIRPSRSEGMGNSFIEAMAAGIPVIATQEGGIADFLFDEKKNPDRETTGWAVAKDNPEEIAAAVKDIIARPEKVEEVTRYARELVIQKYDWNDIARSMRQVFDHLTGTVQ